MRISCGSARPQMEAGVLYAVEACPWTWSA